jgi:hypothetical protein
MVIIPAYGTRQAMDRSRVVLPAPLGPMMPSHCPAGTCSLTPASAQAVP